MITKAQLHKVEMNLAYLFDEKTLSREDIINEFTNLMGIVDKDASYIFKELSKIKLDKTTGYDLIKLKVTTDNTETNYINLTEEEFNKIKDVIK